MLLFFVTGRGQAAKRALYLPMGKYKEGASITTRLGWVRVGVGGCFRSWSDWGPCPGTVGRRVGPSGLSWVSVGFGVAAAAASSSGDRQRSRGTLKHIYNHFTSSNRLILPEKVHILTDIKCIHYNSQ